MKIAVIGAGLAGLSAAWLLSRRHSVSLFERQARPGFTASSVSLPGAPATSLRGDPAQPAQRVDVPLRVFYPGYYPTLTRLYDRLGVSSEPVSYATSFTRTSGAVYFRYRNWRWGDRSWAYLLPGDFDLAAAGWQILRDLLRFHRQARRHWRDGQLKGLSIGDYVREHRYSEAFVADFLLPAIATVGTCTVEQARRFPAGVIIEYLARGLTRDAVRRALAGADEVERRLLAGIGTLRPQAAISRLRPDAEGIWLECADAPAERFDQVILATQANQALALLGDDHAAERRLLQAFRYSPVEVITHTDATLMPPRRTDWSPVNLMVSPEQPTPQSTIWINAVQPSLRGAPDVFQTVHPHRAPTASAVLGRARFERPVVDAASEQAVRALQALQGQRGRRIWFCGSYASPGIPLLESAVSSAHQVVSLIDPGLD